MIVEQFLPALHYGDAIGNSALSLHRFLMERGAESRIIAMTIDENLKDQASFFSEYRENPRSLKILHFAIPSALTDAFIRFTGKKAMIYHNITPHHFFTNFSDHLTRFCYEGREHLKRLKNVFQLSIAVSRFNARDLTDLDFPNVRVFPLIVNLKDYQASHSIPYYNLYRDERKNIIFVGRITPNKKIEDLIKTLFFYKKYLSPSIRLIISGNTLTLPKYFHAVRDLAARFYLTADDIVFTGHIPFAELLSVYRLGDVFLSMSEHEGFCLPLIEAGFFRVPIVAYDAGAVAETLDGSGLVFSHKKYELVAGLLENVLENAGLRKHLQNMQEQRIDGYLRDAEPGKLASLLESL